MKTRLTILIVLIFAVTLFSQGIPYNQEFQVNTFTKSFQWKPCITTLSDGSFLIIWTSFEQVKDASTEIFAQNFNADCSKRNGEYQITNSVKYDQDETCVAVLENKELVVCCWESMYQDGSGSGIFAQKLSTDGSVIGSDFQVNTVETYNQFYPNITSLSDGDYAICWLSGEYNVTSWDVKLQCFNSDGNKKGEEIKVNTNIKSYKVKPIVRRLSNGGFVVFWNGGNPDYRDWRIYFQCFNEFGTKDSNELQLVENYENNQYLYDIVTLADKSLLVSWASRINEKYTSIYAQRFYDNITKYDDSFKVNTNTMCEKAYSKISVLSDSNFVICWQSSEQDNSRSGVFAQRFYSDCSKMGYEFQVNSYSIGSQGRPCVTALLNGDFVISWMSMQPNDSGWDIFAKHISSEVEDAAKLPMGIALEQNYPNPFNPVTTVRYSLPKAGPVALKLYDITGREVMSLVNEWQAEGAHSIKVDCRSLASGVYVYKLTAGDYCESKKMALVR